MATRTADSFSSLPSHSYKFFFLTCAALIAAISCTELIKTASATKRIISHFEFPSFHLSSVANLSVMGDAQPTSQGVLQVTRNAQDVSLKSSVGRALYNSPITLWSPITNATSSFNTTFTFSVRNLSSSFGDGFAFIITSDISTPIPSNSSGGWLGLVNASTNGNSSNQFVAVEFDTYQNVEGRFNLFDVDDNHVGIDANDVISRKSISLNTTGIFLKSGNQITAWIDYDGDAKRMDVYVSYKPLKPSNKPPLLSYTIDLSKLLLPDMYVGFSAATGTYVELHNVYSWNFSSSIMADPGSSTSDTNTTTTSAKLSKAVLVVIISLCSILGIVLAILLIWRVSNRRNRQRVLSTMGSYKTKVIESSMINLKADFLYGPRKFTYRELSAATSSFSEKLVLGRGGFGSVYKGVLQGDGTVVAVKRTSKSSTQGEREFLAEVSIIGRLRHRNLVELIGWCHERGELLLVYEFMPNGSLDRLLFSSSCCSEDQVEYHHDQAPQAERLSWKRRYDIVCGLASALLYLHEEWEQQVVHRDVKASNVMLDANFTARLGDFGLARLVAHNQNPETTIAAGTMGYLAPEVSQSGKATTKSDVFSFGMVALEVACRRRPIDRSLTSVESVLLDWVWQLHSEGRIWDAADIDDEEKESVDWKQVTSMLQLGLACSHPDPNSRPSIRQVFQILKGDATLAALPLSKPVPSYSPFLPCTIQDLVMTDQCQHSLSPDRHRKSPHESRESIDSTNSTSASLISGITPR